MSNTTISMLILFNIVLIWILGFYKLHTLEKKRKKDLDKKYPPGTGVRIKLVKYSDKRHLDEYLQVLRYSVFHRFISNTKKERIIEVYYQKALQ